MLRLRLIGIFDSVYVDRSCDAVEFSHRSGRDLVNMAKKRTNVIPIIEDARHPAKYRMLVGMVDVIFSDVAQPDQVWFIFSLIYLKGWYWNTFVPKKVHLCYCLINSICYFINYLLLLGKLIHVVLCCNIDSMIIFMHLLFLHEQIIFTYLHRLSTFK
jgi:hypothetical protein